MRQNEIRAFAQRDVVLARAAANSVRTIRTVNGVVAVTGRDLPVAVLALRVERIVANRAYESARLAIHVERNARRIGSQNVEAGCRYTSAVDRHSVGHQRLNLLVRCVRADSSMGVVTRQRIVAARGDDALNNARIRSRSCIAASRKKRTRKASLR